MHDARRELVARVADAVDQIFRVGRAGEEQDGGLLLEFRVYERSASGRLDVQRELGLATRLVAAQVGHLDAALPELALDDGRRCFLSHSLALFFALLGPS